MSEAPATSSLPSTAPLVTAEASRLDQFNRWIQPVSNLGVLVGLVLVILQLKQNADTTRAQSRTAVMQAVLTLNQMEREPQLIEAYMRQRNGQPLTAIDDYYLEKMANATLRVWENTFYQHHMGLFDDSELEADMVVWRESMKEPEYASHWRANRLMYSAAFRNVIDGLISTK